MRHVVRPAPETQACSRLSTLAGDVREIVSRECPRCQGSGSDCAVEQLQEAASDAASSQGTIDRASRGSVG